MSLRSHSVVHRLVQCGRLHTVTTALCLAAVSAGPIAAQVTSDTSFSLPRNAVVDITMRSGRLVVRGTDRSTAELRSDDQRFDLRASGVGVVLAARDERENDNRSRSRDRRLELTVPRGVRLVISAGSADVDVQDIAGDVEIHSLSGDVTLRAIGGRMIVETLSGDVRLGDGSGEARVTTMSGDITLRDVRASADVHTTSGDVILSVLRAGQVKVESMSGDIRFDGDLAAAARVRFATHSGDVTMRLPEATRGTMELSTFNGELSSDQSLTLTAGSTLARSSGERTRQRFELGGGGGAHISITTFNGDIRLERSARRTPDEEQR